MIKTDGEKEANAAAEATEGEKRGEEVSAPLRKSLERLLKTFGYETQEEDTHLLDWAIDRGEGYVRQELNIEYLTLDMAEPMLNMAAGEFLKAKRASAPQKPTGIELPAAVKRIEVGDTNTEFAVGGLTSEQRFDLFAEYLIKSAKDRLSGYRRIKW